MEGLAGTLHRCIASIPCLLIIHKLDIMGLNLHIIPNRCIILSPFMGIIPWGITAHRPCLLGTNLAQWFITTTMKRLQV